MQSACVPGASLVKSKLPRHVAVIMDGNGRWAQQRGLPRIEGHRHGVASVRRITEETARLGIGQVTLYCLSSENWKRPAHELDFLMHLLEQYMIEERSNLMAQNIRLTTIGRRQGIPPSVQQAMDATIAMTSQNTGSTLCLAINYGARQEIVDAVRSFVQKARQGEIVPEGVDEVAVSNALYTAGMPDPDLLIRTAGEMRLSNYLLWQLSYAEIWVTQTCWPDFTEAHYWEALLDFANRDRRFGGLNPQL